MLTMNGFLTLVNSSRSFLTDSILFFVMILNIIDALHCFRHLLHGVEMPCLAILHFPHFAKTSLAYHVQHQVLLFVGLLSAGGWVQLGFHPVVQTQSVSWQYQVYLLFSSFVRLFFLSSSRSLLASGLASSRLNSIWSKCLAFIAIIEITVLEQTSFLSFGA